MGTSISFATYQFSNAELQEMRALLQGITDVLGSPILTERANIHIQTINQILAARTSR